LIVFQVIRYKNILSTGNVFTEINLNKNKNTLIIGKNGSGKTTVLDALTFVLFGKPYRNVNKPGIVNSINRAELVVELEFRIGTNQYKIVRGMKPNVFEIYKDHKLLDQMTCTADYQDYLEKYILKMTHKTFTQVVILGAASFRPFMQLAPAARRSIIEDLLDIQIFTTMNIIAKQRLQQNKEKLEKKRISITLITEKVNILRKTLEGLKSADINRRRDLANKIDEYQSDIDTLKLEQTRIPELEDIIDVVSTSLKTHNSNLVKLQNLHSGIKSNLEHEENERSFFHDNESCPTCKQEMSQELRAGAVTKNYNKILEFNDAISKLIIKTTLLRKDIDVLEKEKQTLQSELNNIKSKSTEICHYERQIVESQKQLKEPDVSADILMETKDALDLGDSELEVLETEKQELLKERQYCDMINVLLKDGGIKTKIIKQYLPLINKYINQYLNGMGFYVGFNIDENFEECIKSRFRDDFMYDNFSEGEKKRIDLAILFAWRTIARLKNSINTNLLIFDETFDSSLDGEGTDEFMQILKNLTSDNNTFIISHKQDQLAEKFDRVIRFIKEKDFSRISE